jgi:hypothetical protein
MKIFTRYVGAGTTGHVFRIPSSGGQNAEDLGVGASPILWAWSGDTIAVVPTGVESMIIELEALTKSNLLVRFGINFSIKLDPGIALRNFNFAVDAETDWREDLRPMFQSWAQGPVRDLSQATVIENILTKQTELIASLETHINSKLTAADVGVTLIAVEISKIEPKDANVSKALGATTREALLMTEQTAVHTRQMSAQTEATALAQKRIQDDQALAEQRKEQIAADNANTLALAEGEAKAEEARLKPFADVDKGVLTAIAFQKMAEKGVGRLDISTELLQALGLKLDGRA